MSTWLECSTLAEAEAVDAVAEVFGRLGQGVAIEEPIISSADGEQVQIDGSKPVLVKTYLPPDERTEARRRQLEEAIWHLGRLRHVESLRIKDLREEDWAEAWKKHFYVHRAGERLVIVPSWRRYRARPDDLVLQLDPGMAFGTGLHPTTRLCLRALESRLPEGACLLDLGTGSGILAIAAARLGAGRVLALDIDAVAARVADENVARNALAESVDVRQGSLPLDPPATETFDLIVANISFRVLCSLHAELRQALRPCGLALLSGVLGRDAPRLLDLLRSHGWRLIEQQDEADWSLLAVVPGPADPMNHERLSAQPSVDRAAPSRGGSLPNGSPNARSS
jgi:ribosomal protein L11 methyltransferase